MVVGDSYESEVFWIGQPLKNIFIPKFACGEGTFYKKCIFGALSIEVGDYVLILNADSAEPDTVIGCDVARILHFYEINDEMSPKDPYRAIVQWYSRPDRVPHKFFDDDNICIHFDMELIEDYRPFDQDISIETIFGKCMVIRGGPDDSPIGLLKALKKTLPMFVCRYKFLKVKNKYKLIPLDAIEDSASSNDTRILRNTHNKTPSKTPRNIANKVSSSGKKLKKDRLDWHLYQQGTEEKAKLQEVEFLDINTFKESEKQSVVSPIKIVKNRIIKTPRNSSDNVTSMSSEKRNSNYLMASPAESFSNTKAFHKASGARRNLNISLDNEITNTEDSDILNYSIIKDTPDKTSKLNDMKIILRVSEKQKQNSKTIETGISQAENKIATRRNTCSSSEDVRDHLELSCRKKCADEDPMLNTMKTPSKRSREVSVEKTPNTKTIDTQRRKSILKTPGSRSSVAEGTPKRNIQLSNIVEEMIYEENSTILTPSKKRTPRMKKQIDDEDYVYETITPNKRKSLKRTSQSSADQLETPKRKVKLKSDTLTAIIDSREKISNRRKSDLQIVRERLHVSSVPDSLPCREAEFQNIYTFLEGKIRDKCGGCMYVSGVPGTGKTATVTGAIRCLQRQVELEEIPVFDFIEINGMKLAEPRQSYVQIYKQLTGKTVSWEHAHSLLEKRFSTPAPRRITTILLVDELDILCNRRQDVVYNLLDWPTKAPARLVVITIANTMDLPERLLMGRVTSRLGLTRLTFQPYTHKQLQQIVTARLVGFVGFQNDAVQLVARKVAAVSGDARRALDICRRAIEIAEENGRTTSKDIVDIGHVSQALAEMIASAKVQAIKNCSKLEQIFLQAVSAEVIRTGVEETNFMGVYNQLESMTAFMGIPTPIPGHALRICSKLGAERLLICEHSRTDLYQKILLNVSTDDIHYALQINLN